MTSNEGGKFPLPPQAPSDLPFIDHALIEEQLAAFSNLDRNRLLDTLVPHRELPTHDIAGYIIDQYGKDDRDGSRVGIRTSYGLGVVFARSLVVKAIGRSPEVRLLPVISDLDQDKKQLVDTYIDRASRKSIRRLTRHGESMHEELERAIALFAGRCEVVVPDKMLDADSGGELRRGAHDYFSVYTLLESEGRQERTHLKKRLGGTMLVGGLFFGLMLGARNKLPTEI